MDPSIIANIKHKFQVIRRMYKEEVGHNTNNILPIIGIQKQVKQEEPKYKDHTFNISDIINKERRKTQNKYSKFLKLHHGQTTRKKP